MMFAGYQVPTRYYHSLAEALAQNGYAVIQVIILGFQHRNKSL